MATESLISGRRVSGVSDWKANSAEPVDKSDTQRLPLHSGSTRSDTSSLGPECSAIRLPADKRAIWEL